MNGFEEFIDFLASKGVKSFHIEMQECKPLNSAEKEERTIEKPAAASKPYPVQDALAKHDIPVYRGGEGQALVALPLAVERALPAKVVKPNETAMKGLAEERAAEEEKRADAAREKLVEKVIAPIAEKAVATATQAKAKVKTDAEKAASVAAGKIDPKNLFDHFCTRITTDDGTFTVEERAALIERMGLDDLLRVNNDFSLGLDTDKPVEDVREDVINCFP